MICAASYNNTGRYSDWELIEMFRNGDKSAFSELTDRYLNFIRSITSKYNISGLEPDDLTQEGLVGLLCAVNTYKINGGASFKTYAGLCISRRIVSLLNRSTGNKNKPLNDYISLYDDDVSGSMPYDSADPENLVISKENFLNLSKHISGCLSDTEKRVFKLYLSGESYEQISAELQMPVKSVDNALQRVRKKLRKHID